MSQYKKAVRAITSETINDPATVAEFAAYMHIGEHTVRRMIHAGKIKAYLVGEQYRINVAESLKMLGHID